MVCRVSFRKVTLCLYDLRRPTYVPKLCLAVIQQEAVIPWWGGKDRRIDTRLEGHAIIHNM